MFEGINKNPKHLKAVLTRCDFLLFCHRKQSRSMQNKNKKKCQSWVATATIIRRKILND